jgi:hypothetical protein
MRLLLMVVLCTGVGCSSSAAGESGLHGTDEVEPSKLIASYGAFSDGKTLSVYVAYIGNGFLRVHGNDSIAVDVNGATVAAPEVVEGDKVHYEPVVTPAPEQAVVTVTFRRGDATVVAKRTLTPNFELVAPPADIHAGDSVSVDLSPRPPPGFSNALEVNGTCIDGGGQKILVGNAYPLAWDTKTLKLVGSEGCDLEVKVHIESIAAPAESHGMELQGVAFEAAQIRSFRAKLTR